MKAYFPVKRLLDLLISAVLLIALSPLLLILTLVIRLTSPGPAVFTQKRVGRNKKLFTIYKFRTMRQDAPKDVPTHLMAHAGSYLTPVGGFLRKTSLDELPQLWNILRGDMAFVGPRPALYNQTDLIAERDLHHANGVRPGLTGLAQVRGRDELPIPVKAAYDGEYAARITPLADLKIILLTAAQVVQGKGVVDAK